MNKTFFFQILCLDMVRTFSVWPTYCYVVGINKWAKDLCFCTHKLMIIQEVLKNWVRSFLTHMPVNLQSIIQLSKHLPVHCGNQVEPCQAILFSGGTSCPLPPTVHRGVGNRPPLVMRKPFDEYSIMPGIWLEDERFWRCGGKWNHVIGHRGHAYADNRWKVVDTSC